MSRAMFANHSPALPVEIRRGTMLAELVIAIAISAILLLGIQSAMSIALRGVPDAKSGAAATLQANRIADQLTTELETATYISERSATSIGFTVPDRNGDDIPERVRYQWTGTPGGKLTRQYNGGTAETIAESVDLFNVTPSTKSVSETYPLVGVEDLLESLLVDNNSTSGLANNDVTTSNWIGQYFTLTLPAGAFSWRPTRVQFMAKKNSVPGTTSVQLQSVSNSMTPSGTVLEQYTIADTAMTTSYAWQSFNITTLGSQASGASLALVLQRTGGSKSLTAQSTTAFPGMEKSSNGNSWSYDNGKALVSRLYGKLTRSTGTGSFSTSYFTSMDLALRMSASAPTLRTTAALLNHPEVLNGKWELNFDKSPTTEDVNGDGAMDWSVSGGGTFNTASLTDGVWRSSGVLLNSNPGSDFAQTTVVDVKFQSINRGGRGATFSMNALRSGSRCAPVIVTLALQSDGSQTLNLQTKTADLVTSTLLSINRLPAQPTYLHLVVHPNDSSVSMTVNGVDYGTFSLLPFLSSDASRAATIGADGGVADFWYASIRVLEN